MCYMRVQPSEAPYRAVDGQGGGAVCSDPVVRFVPNARGDGAPYRGRVSRGGAGVQRAMNQAEEGRFPIDL